MLTGIHFLLSYACTFECDHCFLYCSPQAEGTFTLRQLRQVYQEIDKMPAVREVYLEGGEPFLFYPLMLEAARMAGQRDMKLGFVTNCYWATDTDDAELWLKPLKPLDIYDISISDDAYHHGENNNPARNAHRAAENLGLPVSSICIEAPEVAKNPGKGEPVVTGGAMMRGRAADKLTEGLPTRPWEEMTSCPHEELIAPRRVHIDSFGNVHVCQGLSMGNMWQTPLSELDKAYDAARHPICEPLVKGGPAELVRRFDVPHGDRYVDECHLCCCARRELIDRFPDCLGPHQVYGLDSKSAT